MKKLILIPFLLISLLLMGQTNYYIDPAGTDGAGHTGLIGDKWKTLGYAVTRVTTAGDTIHIDAGTYNEGQCYLAKGVSIVGEPYSGTWTSKINCNFTNDDSWTYIRQGNITIGTTGDVLTDGNQTVKNIWFDGTNAGDTSTCAIAVVVRSNVLIHDCKISNFKWRGIIYMGTFATATSYSLNNKIYNDTIENCGHYVPAANGGTACIYIEKQDRIDIYNNYLRNDYLSVGKNAFGIKNNFGNLKNIKIHDNVIRTEYRTTAHFSMAIETFYGFGANKIYNNIIENGNIDLAGYNHVKGDSSYSWHIYDNSIIQDDLSTSIATVGIAIEALLNYADTAIIADVIIENNYLKNWDVGLEIYQGHSNYFERIRINNNVFENIGYNWKNGGYGITISSIIGTAILKNVWIYNNVFYNDGVSYDPYYGININATGHYGNIYIRNNIFEGFTEYFLKTQVNSGTPVIDALYINNNDQYGNGNSNNYLLSLAPTYLSYSGYIKVDPLLTAGSPYDFNLQAGSPCINTGVYVGLPFQGTNPEIGAYEFTEPPVYTQKVFVKDSNGKFMKDVNGKLLIINK